MLIFNEAEDKWMNKTNADKNSPYNHTNFGTNYKLQYTDNLRTILHFRDCWDCNLELTEQHRDHPQTIIRHCYSYFSNFSIIFTDYITSQLHKTCLLTEQVWMMHCFSQDGNSFCWETLQSEIKQEWGSLDFFHGFSFCSPKLYHLETFQNSGRGKQIVFLIARAC